MIILYRHIAKSVIVATLVVLALVISLTFFVGLLTELRDVGTGDYGFSQAVSHVVLQLPYNSYQFFPMSMLLGGIIGLGMLATHHELMVMRASGVSIVQIIFAVMLAAIVMIFAATLLGEGLSPKGNHLAQTHKETEQNKGQAVLTATGVWMHQQNSFLHVERILGESHLEGVTRYEFDNVNRLLAASFAASLDYDHNRWLARNVSVTSFGHDKTTHQEFKTATWDLQLNPHQLNVGFIEPGEMSLKSLHSYMHHLKSNKLQSIDFEFAFWKRLLQPLATLVMILLAIPFVFAGPRSVTLGWRILFGVIVGFAFYTFNAFLAQLSIVFQLPPFASALLPILLFGVVGALLVRKV